MKFNFFKKRESHSSPLAEGLNEKINARLRVVDHYLQEKCTRLTSWQLRLLCISIGLLLITLNLFLLYSAVHRPATGFIQRIAVPISISDTHTMDSSLIRSRQNVVEFNHLIDSLLKDSLSRDRVQAILHKKMDVWKGVPLSANDTALAGQ